MKLCIDIGNSQIYGGLFDGEKLVSRFRKITQRGASSDELGPVSYTHLRAHETAYTISFAVFCV